MDPCQKILTFTKMDVDEPQSMQFQNIPADFYKGKPEKKNVQIVQSPQKIYPEIYIKKTKNIKKFGTSHKFRIMLFEALEAADKKYGLLKLLDACDLRTIFDVSSIKILSSDEKSSVSETVILLGKFKIPIVFATFQGNTKIAIKMSFKPLTSDNSLEIERRAYKEVTNPLLLNGNTPHVMLYVGTLHCSNFSSIDIGEMNNKKFMKEIQKIQASQRYDTSDMWMLILEQGKGKPLRNFINETHTLKKFWYPVLFQIIYTLSCFQLVGFAQNDLHSGNLWIDELPEPQEFIYQGNKKYAWRIETKYIVKFFDFDRAAKSATKYNAAWWTNKKLDDEGHCISGGQCNGYQPFFDAFNILYNIYHYHKNINRDAYVFLKKWIENYIEYEYLNKKYAWHGQLCECVIGEPLMCKKCNLITPTNPVLETMLQTGFESYRIDPKDIENEQYVWKLPSFK